MSTLEKTIIATLLYVLYLCLQLAPLVWDRLPLEVKLTIIDWIAARCKQAASSFMAIHLRLTDLADKYRPRITNTPQVSVECMAQHCTKCPGHFPFMTGKLACQCHCHIKKPAYGYTQDGQTGPCTVCGKSKPIYKMGRCFDCHEQGSD